MRYVSDRRPQGPQPDYFATGILVHAILHFMQDGVLNREESPRDWKIMLTAAAVANFDPTVITDVEFLMSCYWLKYSTDNAGWPEEVEIIAAEMEFRDEDTFDLPYTARADTVLRIRDQIVIPDTKTRGRKIPIDRDEYRMDLSTKPQFIGLSYLAMKHFHLDYPPAIWVNGIIKTKTPQFDRLLVPIRQGTIDMWIEQQKVIASRGLDLDDMNFAACAPEVGFRCQYFDICHK